MSGGVHTRLKPQCSGRGGGSPENDGAQRKATPGAQGQGCLP